MKETYLIWQRKDAAHRSELHFPGLPGLQGYFVYVSSQPPLVHFTSLL